jgi:hypothetical protein
VGTIDVVARFRLKSLRAGLGPLAAEFEPQPGERDQLHPLFVFLRDRRALLDASRERAYTPYVTESIESIREELTTTLKALPPDAAAAPRLETLRNACREYLDAVGSTDEQTAETAAGFASALGQLRASFYEVAEWVGERYELPSASELAADMRAADEFAADQHELDELRSDPG